MADLGPDFEFVDDAELRFLLDEYQSQAARAYEAGAYIGALVGSGAVVEGMLTWALCKRREEAIAAPAAQKRDGKVLPVEQWNLSNLIEVAASLRLLGTTAKDASWAVKDFRNLVHPFNVLRQSARPDQALAASAMAAVREITRSLRGRMAK